MTTVTKEYRNKVLKAFEHSRKRQLPKADFKVGNRIITNVPYQKLANGDYAFDAKTYAVLKHAEQKSRS